MAKTYQRNRSQEFSRARGLLLKVRRRLFSDSGATHQVKSEEDQVWEDPWMWARFFDLKKRLTTAPILAQPVTGEGFWRLQWCFEEWPMICVNAEGSGNRLCLTTTEAIWAKLPCSWLGIRSSSLCSKNLEALPIWWKVRDLYGSQKFKVFFHTKKHWIRGNDDGLSKSRITTSPFNIILEKQTRSQML